MFRWVSTSQAGRFVELRCGNSSPPCRLCHRQSVDQKLNAENEVIAKKVAITTDRLSGCSCSGNGERVSDQERNRDHREDYRDLHKRRELMPVGHESRAPAGIPTYEPHTQNQEADKCAAVLQNLHKWHWMKKENRHARPQQEAPLTA
jgi:hypothetical protein